jgi:hypothetical protein
LQLQIKLLKSFQLSSHQELEQLIGDVRGRFGDGIIMQTALNFTWTPPNADSDWPAAGSKGRINKSLSDFISLCW